MEPVVCIISNNNNVKENLVIFIPIIGWVILIIINLVAWKTSHKISKLNFRRLRENENSRFLIEQLKAIHDLAIGYYIMSANHVDHYEIMQRLDELNIFAIHHGYFSKHDAIDEAWIQFKKIITAEMQTSTRKVYYRNSLYLSKISAKYKQLYREILLSTDKRLKNL